MYTIDVPGHLSPGAFADGLDRNLPGPPRR